jgi:ABC-2 type transport system permease protein
VLVKRAEAGLVRAPQGWRRVRATLLCISAFVIVELQKLQHDRTELCTRMVIFGTTLNKLHVIDTGSLPYLAFLAPGVIAQSGLFISIFYGIQIIWDRDAAILPVLLVTPAPASALIAGKSFAAGVCSVAQVVGVLVLAYLMGVHLTVNPLRILAAMAIVVLGAAFFASLSMTLAGLVRNRDRLMGIGQAITMPLFFASNALYPLHVMPAWLRALSTINPLSYEVDVLRALLIGTRLDPLDIIVLGVAAIVAITAATAVVRRLVQ